MKTGFVVLCTLVAAAAFVALPFVALDRAPLAYELYFNQKIFYYHMPAASLMFVAPFVCGIMSIAYLVKRKPEHDDLAAAAGDLTVVFGAVVLTTGPIWGKIAWGTWWVWDARLTTSLLLEMIFIAYALVRRYGGPGAPRLAAGLAIFGMADVPLVYFAVNFWKTQHPTNTVVPNLRGGMREGMLVGCLAYLCLFILFVMIRRSLHEGERRLAAAHDQAADAGILES